MKKGILNIISILILVLAASCHKDEPTPTPPQTLASRTVLVYMVANNSLGSTGFDTDDLKEMLTGVSAGALGESGRLLVFHEATTGVPTLKEVTAEGITTLKSYSGDDKGVYESTMRNVFDDMKSTAPAERYGLILWSHASGWIEDGVSESRNSSSDPWTPQPLSFGVSGKERMNTSTLARILKDYNFDFLYFDCCYMMGIESVYELRHVAPVIAGSPTELPSAGMPYDSTLPYFFKDGDADIVGAARTTFDYYNSLSGSARTSTMSVVNTAGLDRLAAASAAIYAVSEAGMPGDPFQPQRYSAISVSKCNYFDFAQYMRYLSAGYPDLLAEFNAALEAVVIYEDATPYLWSTIPLAHHSGLSTYILPSYNSAETQGYSNLEWWKDAASTLKH